MYIGPIHSSLAGPDAEFLRTHQRGQTASDSIERRMEAFGFALLPLDLIPVSDNLRRICGLAPGVNMRMATDQLVRRRFHQGQNRKTSLLFRQHRGGKHLHEQIPKFVANRLWISPSDCVGCLISFFNQVFRDLS